MFETLMKRNLTKLILNITGHRSDTNQAIQRKKTAKGLKYGS